MKRKTLTPRGWIYARVGVDFLGHQRLMAIPASRRAAALGVWLAATLYCRGRETDGFCPMGAIGEIASAEIVDELVAVGLFAREVDQVLGHGVRVLKFEVFNETKAQILSRKADVKKRVTEHRGNKSVTRYNDVSKGGSNGVVPVSVSPSSSSDLERESARGVEPPPRETGLARSVTGDGAMGLAVAAYCDAIRRVTGGTAVPPRGEQLAQLNDAIRRGSADAGEDPVEWARRAATAFALEGGKLNVFRFVEFIAEAPVSEKGPTRRPGAPPEGPQVADDALTGEAAAEQLARLQATLARAGRLPGESAH